MWPDKVSFLKPVRKIKTRGATRSHRRIIIMSLIL